MISRRRFLQTSAAIGGAAMMMENSPMAPAAENGPLSAAQQLALPKVDTHQHLWDLSKFRLPWLASATDLNRSYVSDDYRRATEGLNVVKAVYMEVDVDPAQQVDEAEHLIELCQSGETATCAAVISGRPASTDFAAYIRKYKDSPYIKGVRQVLHAPSAQQGLCLDAQFTKSIQLLGELGMSFDLCMRPSELGDGVKLVDQCPDTRFIVDHCGNADPAAFAPQKSNDKKPWHDADQWKRDMAAFAERDRVICKISGIVARAEKGKWTADDLAPAINYCLDTFGPDRVVFGGDWPVCTLAATYGQWTEALLQIIRSRPEEQQRKLLHDNAVRIYGLS